MKSIINRSLPAFGNKKFGLYLLIGLCFSAAVAAALYYGSREFMVSRAEQAVQNILLMNRALHQYVQRNTHKALYTLQDAGEVPKTFYSPEILSSSMMSRCIHDYFNEIRRQMNMPELYYKFAACNPRNPVNMGDSFELELIRMFNENESVHEYRKIIERNGRTYLYYARPFLRTGPACLRCHGKPEDAPRRLRERYGDVRGFHAEPGGIRAIESLRVPLERHLHTANLLFAALLAGAAVVAGLVFFNVSLQAQVRSRKRTLEREIAERLRLAAAVDQAAETILIMNTDGTIQYVNPAMTRLMGYTLEEVSGRNPFTTDRGDYPNDFYRTIWETISAGRVWSGQLKNSTRDGRPIDFEVTISPIRDAGGAISGYVSIGRDVTRERRMQEQLRQAQKLEAVGILAGGIAHEFNNILGAIIGNAELAQDDVSGSSPVRENLDHIIASGIRARDLVRQLLAFSRKNSQRFKPVQLSAVVSASAEKIRSDIPDNIDINQSVHPDTGVIVADQEQIGQVILNLAANAVRAMQGRGGVLSITAEAVDLDSAAAEHRSGLVPGRYARLTVSDTGCGIEPDILDRIFEPFFTTAGVGEGAGMGLAVVHGIVKAHGGTIEVASTPGEGSRFDVFLPAARNMQGSAP